MIPEIDPMNFIINHPLNVVKFFYNCPLDADMSSSPLHLITSMNIINSQSCFLDTVYSTQHVEAMTTIKTIRVAMEKYASTKHTHLSIPRKK